MSCQIKEGKYYAPNGAESKLYSELKDKVGEEQAHNLFVLAYTPSFIKDVQKPIIYNYKSRLPEAPSNLTFQEKEKGKVRTIEVLEEGEVKGRIILSRYKDGYKIKSSFVEEQERGKGIGKSLYNQTAKQMITEGLNLYSDQTRTESADIMWGYLSQLGVSQDGRTVLAKPSTIFNSDGEIDANKVLAYATKINESVQPLTLVEQQEIRMLMAEFPDISNSDILLIKLEDAFYKKGMFSPTKQSLGSLYSNYEVDLILNDMNVLGSVKEAIERLKRTPTITNDTILEATYKSNEVNILGKLKNQNPYIIQQDIIEEFGGVENPDLSEIKDRTIDEEFLAKFQRVPAISENGSPIVEEIIYPSAVKVVTDSRILESVDAILNAPSSVDTIVLEKKVSDNLLNYGIKVEGFSKDLLPYLREFLVNPTAENTRAFSNAYRDEFNIPEKQREYVVKMNNQGRDLVYLDTTQSEQQLFDSANLLRTETPNVYHKVERVDFQEMKRALNLEENVTELQAYKDYFGYGEIGDSISRVFKPISVVSSLEYLTNEFISDMNVEVLKNTGSGLYSKFKITEKGVELKYADPISLAEINAYLDDGSKLSQAIRDYSIISKQMGNLTNSVEIPLNNKYNNRLSAVNNFKSVKVPTQEYSKINKDIVTVKNAVDEFISVDNELYELVDKQGNESVYSRIQKNLDTVYNATAVSEPTGVKITSLKSVRPTLEYSKVNKQWKDAEVGDRFSC